MTREDVLKKLYDKYITPTKSKRDTYIGVEIEMPIVNLEGKAVDFDVVHLLTSEFLHGFGFQAVGFDEQGKIYNAVNKENGDVFSYDCSYNNLELSFGKEKNIDNIHARFEKYYNFIQHYFKKYNYTLTGMGINPNRKVNKNVPIENGRYKATYYMSAKDIAENVKISFLNSSGKAVNFSLMNDTPFVKSFEYSPTDYLNTLSKSSDKNLAALAESVKIYGNNAKAFFDDGTPDKTVTGLKASDVQNFAPSVTAGKTTVYYGQSLLLRSNTALRLYFKGSIDNCKVTDSKGKSVTFVTGTASGMNYVEIPDITADNLENKFTVTLADGGKVTLSPMTYVYETLLHYENDSSKAQLCSTVRALYNYSKAVQNYLS